MADSVEMSIRKVSFDGSALLDMESWRWHAMKEREREKKSMSRYDSGIRHLFFYIGNCSSSRNYERTPWHISLCLNFLSTMLKPYTSLSLSLSRSFSIHYVFIVFSACVIHEFLSFHEA